MKQTAEGRRQTDDAVLRTALTQYFTTSQESDLVLNEVPLREALAIADVLIVSNALSAYEIKSDFDALRRFERQRRDYERTCDYMRLVTTFGLICTRGPVQRSPGPLQNAIDSGLINPLHIPQ